MDGQKLVYTTSIRTTPERLWRAPTDPADDVEPGSIAVTVVQG